MLRLMLKSLKIVNLASILGGFWVDFGVFFLLILEYLFKEPQRKSKGTPKEKLMCFHTKL